MHTHARLTTVVRLRHPHPQARRRTGQAEDAPAGASAPQRWSDYTVEFHFPEPTELPPPLIQLIDVDFKYPGRSVGCWRLEVETGG